MTIEEFALRYTVPMCGRYSIYETKEVLEQRFHATFVNGGAYRGVYNATPMQQLPIILNEHPETIVTGHVGLCPGVGAARAAGTARDQCAGGGNCTLVY